MAEHAIDQPIDPSRRGVQENRFGFLASYLMIGVYQLNCFSVFADLGVSRGDTYLGPGVCSGPCLASRSAPCHRLPSLTTMEKILRHRGCAVRPDSGMRACRRITRFSWGSLSERHLLLVSVTHVHQD
jgi:hypothetical protein